MAKCTHCEKAPANLKTCAKCKVAQYCDRDCQKADWKAHKKICNIFASANTGNTNTQPGPKLKNIEKQIANPFTRLDQGKYLHDRPETDVFKVLIDSFRIREADDFNFEKLTAPQSVYSNASSSIVPFRAYLTLASTRALLPPWWSPEKQKQCEAFGESGAWNDLRRRVDKQDIMAHYGDQKMPMQLRMFAEAVYGRGSMGQDGTFMRRQMAAMENGAGGFMSMMDMSSFK